jgi:hypothetical protein
LLSARDTANANAAARCREFAVSGHPTAVLPKGLMNSRRLMGFISLAENHLGLKSNTFNQ